MPRTNSISDEADGRSLTPELDEENAPRSPTYASAAPVQTSKPLPNHPAPSRTSLRSTGNRSATQRPSSNVPPTLSPGDRFRATVRKVIQMHRTTSLLAVRGVGAEPGIDPRRDSAH